MLRQLVGLLRRRRGAQSAPTHYSNADTCTDKVRSTDEPPILVTIQRMIDKYLAEEGAEQEISFDDDVCCVCLSRVASVHAYPCGHRISCRLCATIMLKASVKAQEKYFRCIICRSKVYRLRYIRSNPIVAVCKPEAPFALTVLHRGVFNSLRCPITSSRSTMSSSFRPG